MPIIKYEDLLSKNGRDMGFRGLNRGSVNDIIHTLRLAANGLENDPAYASMVRQLREYADAFRDVMLDTAKAENEGKVRNALDKLSGFGVFLQMKDAKGKTNFAAIREEGEKANDVETMMFAQNLLTMNLVGEMGIPVQELVAGAAQQPEPEKKEEGVEIKADPDALKFPEGIDSQRFAAHLVTAMRSDDPKVRADYEAMGKTIEKLNKFIEDHREDQDLAAEAAQFRNDLQAMKTTVDRIGNNVEAHGNSAMLSLVANTYDSYKRSVKNMESFSPSFAKHYAEVCGDLNRQWSGSGLEVEEKDFSSIVPKRISDDPWEQYKIDLFFEKGERKDPRRDLAEAAVCTMHMHRDIPFDRARLREESKKLLNMPLIRKLPDETLKEYLKEDKVLDFVAAVNGPFTVKDDTLGKADRSERVLRDLKQLEREALDYPEHRTKGWKNMIASIRKLDDKKEAGPQLAEVFDAVEKYLTPSKAVRTKQSEAKRTEQAMDVLYILSATNPMAKAKVDVLVDKLNVKRAEKGMAPLELAGRTFRIAREEHANIKRNPEQPQEQKQAVAQ